MPFAIVTARFFDYDYVHEHEAEIRAPRKYAIA